MNSPIILWKWLEDVLVWLKELLLWIPLKVWDGLLDALAGVVEAIPVPSFMENLDSFFASIPSGVAFFLGGLNLGTCVSMIIAAYVIRFLIRRLPVIG